MDIGRRAHRIRRRRPVGVDHEHTGAAVNRDLTAWSTRPLAARGELVELVDSTGRRIVVIPRREGRLLADLHNRVVDDAHATIAAAREHGDGQRATVGDVEAMLVRIVVAALKELARGLLPRRLRRRAEPTAVGKPVGGS